MEQFQWNNPRIRRTNHLFVVVSDPNAIEACAAQQLIQPRDKAIDETWGEVASGASLVEIVGECIRLNIWRTVLRKHVCQIEECLHIYIYTWCKFLSVPYSWRYDIDLQYAKYFELQIKGKQKHGEFIPQRLVVFIQLTWSSPFSDVTLYHTLNKRGWLQTRGDVVWTKTCFFCNESKAYQARLMTHL